MSITGKKVSELTRKERNRDYIPLGTTGRPFPMYFDDIMTDSTGKKTEVRRLGAIKDDAASRHLKVYSDRPYAEVLGIAMREMCTPSMLPLLKRALLLREPGNKNVFEYFEGAPGAGKTFMAEMTARMRSKRGAIKVDCGKKNLGELLFETVLDFGGDRRFYDEFDRRIQQYNAAQTDAQRQKIFHPHSLSLLRGGLGTAFSEDNGKIAIDWHGTNAGLQDADGNQLDSRATLQVVSRTLMDVAKNEGFSSLASNALGMATQKGPLIRAWEEGRPLILDEFNRCKEGTTASLHTMFQFLIGEIDTVTVENTLKEKGEEVGQTYTFRRADQRVGFSVTATANSEDDGSDVYELPESVRSRVPPQLIPVTKQEDWQHRICQIYTGMPISTIYRAMEADFRNDPDLFRQKLLEWRTMGLSEEEVKNIPAHQIEWLNQWEKTLEASERLARFYYSVSQVINTESPLHKTGNLGKLMQELDETFSRKITVDMRKVTNQSQRSLQITPEATAPEASTGIDKGSWSAAPELPEEDMAEDPSFYLGTRLVKTIMDDFRGWSKEIGKDFLWEQIKTHAINCGLMAPDLQEGRASGLTLVSDLLDLNPYRSDSPDVKAGVVRDLLCDYLRGMDPNLSDSNADIMSVHAVREAITMLTAAGHLNAQAPANAGEEADNTPEDAITIFNDDLDTLQEMPLVQSEMLDRASYVGEHESQWEGVRPDEILSQDAFLYSIATPVLRQGNLTAAWNVALSRTGLVEDLPETDAGDSLAMAENRSQTGVAITTLMVSNDNGGEARAVPLHLVWNRAQDKLLIVGDGELPARVKFAFEHSNVRYVNRNDKGATRQVETALGAVLGMNAGKLGDRLKTAFMMRNMLDSVTAQEQASLSSLLARRDTKCFLPNYVLKPGIAG